MKKTHEDQAFFDLIQKSKRKKRWENIFSPFIVVILVILTTATLYLNYFNLGPFTKDQVSGIPNNYLRLNQTDIPISQLIFSLANTYQFNYTGGNVELWMEHYQKGILKEKEQIGTILAYGEEDLPKERKFSGAIAYGLSNEQIDDSNESNILSYSMFMNGAHSRGEIDLGDYGLSDAEGIVYSYGVHTTYSSQSFHSKSLYQIKKGKVMDLFTITTGGRLLDTSNREKQFKNMPNGLVIYLKFI